MWGTGIFYDLWLNSFSGDTTGINVSCRRQTGFTNQGGLASCWSIAGAKKKSSQSGENNIFDEGGKGNKRLFFRRYMKWKSEADDQGFPQVQDHNSVSERKSGCDVLETDLHLLTYECLIY